MTATPCHPSDQQHPNLESRMTLTTEHAAPRGPVLYVPNGEVLTSTADPQAVGDWKATRVTENATVWEKPHLVEAAPVEQADTGEDDQTATEEHYAQRIAELEAKVEVLNKPKPTPPPAPAAPTATTAAAKKERRGFNHWGPWIALWASIGLTASGEYALARFVGFHPLVSGLLPIGIDVYVIQAFRRSRDVAAALTLMVLTNALVHLAEAGLFGVETIHHGLAKVYVPTWWLIVLVSAVAPFIVWRVHRITEPKQPKPKRGDRRRSGTAGPAQVAQDGRQDGMTTGMPEPAPVAVETATDGMTDGTPDDGQPLPYATPVPATGSATSRATSAATTDRPVAESGRHATPSDQPRSRRSGSSSRATNGSTDTDRQVAKLVALMHQRGSADAVKMADATRVTGAPDRTAARRLKAARERFTQTDN